MNSLLCFARYHIRDLKYQYYDIVDGAHDAVTAHPVAAKQAGVAVCGFLGGAMASLFLTLAFKRGPKR
jgi:hypothetical protein